MLPLVEALAQAAAPGIRWMRDPTRGGVATSLNELARDCGLGVLLSEDEIPVRDAVRGACELLGLDPLHIANEGQFLAVVAPDYAEAALEALRAAPGGQDAAIIGEVQEQPAGTVLGTTLTEAPALSTCWWAIRCRAYVRSRRGHGLRSRQRTSKSGLLERNRVCEAFFAREARRLALACREMSERFLRGGRLLAFGRGPYATDAQHVSVEFVHPVIVGNARCRRSICPCCSARGSRPLFTRRYRDGLRPSGRRSGSGGRADSGAAREAMTFALPGTQGSYFLRTCDAIRSCIRK